MTIHEVEYVFATFLGHRHRPLSSSAFFSFPFFGRTHQAKNVIFVRIEVSEKPHCANIRSQAALYSLAQCFSFRFEIYK